MKTFANLQAAFDAYLVEHKLPQRSAEDFRVGELTAEQAQWMAAFYRDWMETNAAFAAFIATRERVNDWCPNNDDENLMAYSYMEGLYGIEIYIDSITRTEMLHLQIENEEWTLPSTDINRAELEKTLFDWRLEDEDE